MTVPMITLNNGVEIPQLGFGVFQIPPEDTKHATLVALETGYRHIDTAQMYGNERGVGEAVRAAGLERRDVFVTTKLSNAYHNPDDALRAFDESLRVLDLGYLDMILMHWPMPKVGDFVDTWKAMEKMYASGGVRAIGVSNFQPEHLLRLTADSEIVPVVNQIEIHPYLVQDEVREFCRSLGIAIEAWSPIAQGAVLDDRVIEDVARAHGRTTAQITLRWHLQRGDIVFPKSVTRSRVEENFAVFDFALSDSEMAAITGLDRNERTGPDPDEFNMVPD